MANEWVLDGDLKTYATSNRKEVLSTSPLDTEGTFNEQVVQQGVVPTGAGWEDISLGTITTAKLMELKLDTAADVRINGTLVLAACTRILIVADITQLEIQQDATATPGFWAHFLGD